MPIIANRNQQVISAGMQPKAQYSRVVSLQVSALGDNTGFSYTEVVGQTCWLLGIKVWSRAKAAVDQMKTSAFWITTGTSIPTSHAEVASWENVLPVLNWQRVRGVWNIYDGMPGFEWEMSRLYKGIARRFAVALQRVGPENELLQVSFHISEG